MNRFRELVADAKKRYPNDDFLASFEDNCRDPFKRKHYRAYNDALTLLDGKSWIVLKEKAIRNFQDTREGQRKEGFFNQLNEAFAYRHLLRRGCTDIRFMEEGRQKSPDIGFVASGTENYCEVKTICISDDEIDRRASPSSFDGAVYFVLGDGFKNKLVCAIGVAWKQIHSAGKNGLVFVLMRFDDPTMHHYQQYRKQLIKFSRDSGFKNLVLKAGHWGNRRICL